MFIDTAITPTHHDLYVKMGVIGLTLIFMMAMNVTWWQYVIVLMVAAGCVWLDSVHTMFIRELSAKSADDVWYLGVYHENKREVWQAYLFEVVPIGRALRLGFHINVPSERTYHLTIRRGMVSEENFCRLASLVWMG